MYTIHTYRQDWKSQKESYCNDMKCATTEPLSDPTDRAIFSSFVVVLETIFFSVKLCSGISIDLSLCDSFAQLVLYSYDSKCMTLVHTAKTLTVRNEAMVAT